jgi:hypothetical protein
MASISGFRFDITGASGSQGLLTPKEGWRAYILPRGVHASQDSTGTKITVDSVSGSSRIPANSWVQVGLSVDNIRQVSASEGGSFTVLGSNVTVSENDRVFLIGTVQPTVTGGSATYTTPSTTIYKRDDDGAATYTNSMITSNANGLIQGFAATNFYDCLIQDGDQSNQGSIIDLTVGAVEGISAAGDALIGGTLTVNGDLVVGGSASITGNLVFGSTLTVVGMSGDYSHTGTAKFGNTVTVNGAFGVTGTAVFGDTATFIGTSGNYYQTGHVQFGHTVTVHGALGVTGTGVFGGTTVFDTAITVGGSAVFSGGVTFSEDVTITGLTTDINRIYGNQGNSFTQPFSPTGVSLTGDWGSGPTVTVAPGSNDIKGTVQVHLSSGGGTGSAYDGVFISYTDGAYGTTTTVLTNRFNPTGSGFSNFWAVAEQGTTYFLAVVAGAGVAGRTYGFNYLVIG